MTMCDEEYEALVMLNAIDLLKLANKSERSSSHVLRDIEKEIRSIEGAGGLGKVCG